MNPNPLVINKTCDDTQDKKLCIEKGIEDWKERLMDTIGQGILSLSVVESMLKSPLYKELTSAKRMEFSIGEHLLKNYLNSDPSAKASGLVYDAFDAGFIEIVDCLLTVPHLSQEFAKYYEEALTHLSSYGVNHEMMKKHYIGNIFGYYNNITTKYFDVISCRTGILIHLALKNKNLHLACTLFALFQGKNAQYLSEKAVVKFNESIIPLEKFLITMLNGTINVPEKICREILAEKSLRLNQASSNLQNKAKPRHIMRYRNPQKPLQLESFSQSVTNFITSFLDTSSVIQLSQSSKHFHKNELLKKNISFRLKITDLLRCIFFAEPKLVEEFFNHDSNHLSNPSLVLARGEGLEYLHSLNHVKTDIMIWKHLSPLEAAAWRGDNFIVKMLLKFVPKDQLGLAIDQLRNIIERSELSENGGYLAPYYSAYKAFCKYAEEFPKANSEGNFSSLTELADLAWNAHRNLPKNGLQALYAHSKIMHTAPLAPFALPVPPNFKEELDRSCLNKSRMDWNCMGCGHALYHSRRIRSL